MGFERGGTDLLRSLLWCSFGLGFRLRLRLRLGLRLRFGFRLLARSCLLFRLLLRFGLLFLGILSIRDRFLWNRVSTFTSETNTFVPWPYEHEKPWVSRQAPRHLL